MGYMSRGDIVKLTKMSRTLTLTKTAILSQFPALRETPHFSKWHHCTAF